MLETSFTVFSTILKSLRDKVDENSVDSRYRNEQKNSFIFSLSQRLIRAHHFIFKAQNPFNLFLDAFIKAPIFHHLDLEYHIFIKINVSSYAISGILSQLILDKLSKCHLLIYYLRKIISVKIAIKFIMVNF